MAIKASSGEYIYWHIHGIVDLFRGLLQPTRNKLSVAISRRLRSSISLFCFGIETETDTEPATIFWWLVLIQSAGTLNSWQIACLLNYKNQLLVIFSYRCCLSACFTGGGRCCSWFSASRLIYSDWLLPLCIVIYLSTTHNKPFIEMRCSEIQSAKWESSTDAGPS